MKFTYLLLIVSLSLSLTHCSQKSSGEIQKAALIPQPVTLNQPGGFFHLNPDTKIACPGELNSKAMQLASLLKPATGFAWEIVESGRKKNVIELSLDSSLKDLGEEGYKLEVQSNKVHITAASESGIFYGIQTLRQLLPAEIERGEINDKDDFWKIPRVSITDNPRFSWRGLMLDCSRTFWSKAYVKEIIRLLALYKMNVLHLHLTDDQGWRIEIDKYPELTQKGARFPAKWNEPEERQGFYSKDDIRELVAFASQNHVTLIPEIEMPGHSLAALACYPELSCTGGPFEIHPFFKGPGIHEDIFCAGNEETFEFFENVLTEVFELFPSEYVHIGGDEAPKARWEACSKCQARIEQEGLADEHELQSWFIKRIERFVNSKGKQLMGWDEIIEGGLSPTATVMYWRGWMEEVPEQVIAQGNQLVMSPTSHCYFDYTYETISTLKAYEYEPVPDGISEEQALNILGVQANFWSHIDRTEAGVDKQLFPRLLAIAEVAWSPKAKRDSLYFIEKVNEHLYRLEELGIEYYPDSTIIPEGTSPLNSEIR